MKRFLLIIAACFPAIGLLAADVEPMPTDTVIRLEKQTYRSEGQWRTDESEGV